MRGKTDFVVVGAGICGMGLGAMLARDGYEVLVLEKLHHLGGRAFLQEKNGFIFDNGLHLVRFGPRGAMASIFRHLGENLAFNGLGTSWLIDADGQAKVFPTNPANFLTTTLLTPLERLRILPAIMQLARLNPLELLETSVADWLDEQGFSEGIRKYFVLLSASMQVCPFINRASAGEMIANLQAVLKKRMPPMYPRKGWRHIFNTFAQHIQRKGSIQKGTKITDVLIRDGKAVGVRAGDQEFPAENVILNLPIQELFSVLDESRVDSSFVCRCKNQRPTSGVVLDYALSHPIRNDAGLCYLWDPMSYGMFTSNLCSEVAPAGKQLLTWFFPTDSEDMLDTKKAKSLATDFETALFNVFPDLQEAIEWRRVSRLHVVDGAEVNVNQHRLKRPGYAVPGIDHLYMVGDSLCAPGAGGDIGVEAVLACYEKITGRLPACQ